MRRITLFLSIILLLLPILSTIAHADSDDYYHGNRTTEQYWNFVLDDDGKYDRYRLPGIVITKENTVIIYGEARTTLQSDGQTAGDEVLMDIYLRRSTNGGKSFGDPIYIAKGQEFLDNGYGETMNNPAMICDDRGVLHVIFSCDVGRKGVWYSQSMDDGVTWSQPRDLSQMLGYGQKYRHLACGPGDGICLENGRLLFSVWVDIGTYNVHTLYSDDHGETWAIGSKVSGNKDESCVVELSDGSVLVNSRQNTLPNEVAPYRSYSVSSTGIDKWSLRQEDKTLIDPACAAGMCSVNLTGLPYSILFVNCASATTRNNLTVKCSFNDGLTWEKEYKIDSASGGYSDIAVDQTGKVYVVYETNQGRTVNLVTFSFYDVFCKSDATKTTLSDSFSDNLFSIVKDTENLNLKKGTNGEVVAEAVEKKASSLVFDITCETANLRLEEKPFIKLKARCDAGGNDVLLGVYARCGRYDTSNEKLYASAILKGDGEYHDVIFDFSENKYCRGNFYSLELVFPESEDEKVFYECSELSFLSEYTPPLEQSSQTSEGDSNDGNAEQKKGCKSTISIGGAAFVLMTIIPLLKKKRKD